MSRRRLRARDRRALLLGLAVLAPAALYRVGVAPWLEYRAGLASALEAERDLLLRERAALAGAASDREHETELRAALEQSAAWLLAGESSMAASGVLTRGVTEAGRAAGILLQDVQTRAVDEAPGPWELAAVTVRAVGDLEGHARFLHALESGGPLLEVTELTLRPAGVNDGDVERGQLMALGAVIVGVWREGEP